MAKTYDLIIIGAGSAGLTAAEFSNKVGANVALIEKDRVDGDCTWSGCVPSKAILKVAKVSGGGDNHRIRDCLAAGIEDPRSGGNNACLSGLLDGCAACGS